MADFNPTTITRTAVRKLTNPIADVTVFDNIVQGIINSNPFQCVAYTSAGVSHLPVERSREGYTARVKYEDADVKSVGLVTIRTGTIAAFTTIANIIAADTAIAASMGGNPSRDTNHESYSSTLKCHDVNGETYFVSFSRTQVSITSYTDEAIRTRIETWADSVPALA